MIIHFIFLYILTILFFSNFNLNFDEFIIILFTLLILLIYVYNNHIFNEIYKYYNIKYYIDILKFMILYNDI